MKKSIVVICLAVCGISYTQAQSLDKKNIPDLKVETPNLDFDISQLGNIAIELEKNLGSVTQQMDMLARVILPKLEIAAQQLENAATPSIQRLDQKFNELEMRESQGEKIGFNELIPLTKDMTGVLQDILKSTFANPKQNLDNKQ